MGWRIKRPKIRIKRPKIKIKIPKIKPPRISAPRIRIPRLPLQRISLRNIRLPRVDFPTPRIRIDTSKIGFPSGFLRIPQLENILPTGSIPQQKLKFPIKVEIPIEKIFGRVFTIPSHRIRIPLNDIRIRSRTINISIPSIRISSPSIRWKGIRVSVPSATISFPRLTINTPSISIPIRDITIQTPEARISLRGKNIKFSTTLILPIPKIPLPTVTVQGVKLPLPFDSTSGKSEETLPEELVSAIKKKLAGIFTIRFPGLRIPIPNIRQDIPDIRLPSGLKVDIPIPRPSVSVPSTRILGVTVRFPRVRTPALPNYKISIPSTTIRTPNINIPIPDIQIPEQKIDLNLFRYII